MEIVSGNMKKRKKKGILRKNALKNKTNIDIIAKTSLSNVKCVRKYFLDEVTNYIDIYSVRSGSYPTIRHKPEFQPRNTRFITLNYVQKYFNYGAKDLLNFHKSGGLKSRNVSCTKVN